MGGDALEARVYVLHVEGPHGTWSHRAFLDHANGTKALVAYAVAHPHQTVRLDYVRVGG